MVKTMKPFPERLLSSDQSFDQELPASRFTSFHLGVDYSITASGGTIDAMDQAVLRLLGNSIELSQGGHKIYLGRPEDLYWLSVAGNGAIPYELAGEPTDTNSADCHCVVRVPFGKLIPGSMVDASRGAVNLRGSQVKANYAVSGANVGTVTGYLRAYAETVEQVNRAGHPVPMIHQEAILIESENSNHEHRMQVDRPAASTGFIVRCYDSSAAAAAGGAVNSDALISRLKVDCDIPGRFRGTLWESTWMQLRANFLALAGLSADDWDNCEGIGYVPLNEDFGIGMNLPAGTVFNWHVDTASTEQYGFTEADATSGDRLYVTRLEAIR